MRTTEKNSIKIIIADDHPLFRRGLKHALEETNDIQVIGESSNGEDLLSLIKDCIPEIILLDISMPGKSGLDLLKQLKSDYPKLPILILSVYPEEQYAVRFLKAGASGYLTKESAAEKLAEAIRKIVGGGKYASTEVIEKLAFDFSNSDKAPHETLSDREFQVFGMISIGKSLTEIGVELSLSVKTISTHRTRILEKMKMKKNAELIRYAITRNLL